MESCLLDIDISMTSDFVSLVCVLRPRRKKIPKDAK